MLKFAMRAVLLATVSLGCVFAQTAIGGASAAKGISAGTGAGIGTAAANTTGATFSKIKSGAPLIIAFREASIPFSYLPSGSEPVGYAIDLCLRLAEAMRKEFKLPNMQVNYLPVSSAQRIQVMVDGKADLQCSSTTNNAERREKVAFTIPHFITGARFLVKSNSKIDGIADLQGKKVVSTVGTTVIKTIEQKNRERMLGLTILSAANHTQALEMVEKGQADAFVMDDILLYGLASSRPDPTALKIVGKFLTTEPLAIMFNKQDVPLKQFVDKEMRRIIQSGEINRIYAKWFTQPIPPQQQNLNLPPSYLLKDLWKFPSDFVPN
jgi:ABC-type amino acid transport substrate-binding protein